MSRHPFSRHWRGRTIFILAAVTAFAILLWRDAYLYAVAVLLIATFGTWAYGLGDSSDLPGTAGDHDKNIPT